MSAEARGSAPRLRDPRVWLGLAVTAGSLYWVLSGVDFRQIGREMARANLALLMLPSVVIYVLGVWVRARRWRHLTDAIAPVPPGPLFRAVALSFLANNIFPLRLGEVIRAYVLARDTGLPTAAIFGTVIVERLIDVATILGMAAVVLGLGGAAVAGVDATTVLPGLAVLALIPTLGVAALRLAPDRTIGITLRILAWVLPARLEQRVEGILRQIAEGLGCLRGGRHLVWLAIHTLVIWVILAPLPFVAALVAMDIDVGGTDRLIPVAFVMLVWIGAAVGLPSAPGFFGPYHAACWLALRPFGVPKEAAIALGTLAHGAFWLTTSALGLLVLRRGRGGFRGLEDLEEGLEQGLQATSAEPPPSGKDPLDADR